MASISETFTKTLTKIFGSKYARDYKAIQPLVDEINEIFADLKDLSDDELRGKTDVFRERLANGETTDDIMTETFAVVKETCRRLMGQSWKVMEHDTPWNMVPYDCQLVGAIVLHQGKIAEMATGEGKSLVSTMPLYLNALPGKGVHFITVNDYLVQRDVEWYGKIYEFLGLTVGYIKHDMDSTARRAAYACDITYGTNNEFGFDYLRDNMAIRQEDVVQRAFHYALVDEVDSVLVDEARTPLIISGPVGSSTHKYDEMKPVVQSIVSKQVRLVNAKVAEAESILASETGDGYEAGILLLQCLRGAPKNRRLMKLLSDHPEFRKLAMTVESDYTRDKRMQDIDEELYIIVDERNHTITFSDNAIENMSADLRGTFLLPDLNEEISEIEHDDSISAEDKLIKQDEITREFALKSEKIHNANQLLRAFILFEKDQQYVVQDGKVLIVDEFTGRIMSGRRYSDGLHQALEAKENVRIEQETQTLATITLQNYFRMYDKLAGMTGTAETEAGEFWEIYKLDVVVIPTNQPVVRKDREDRIYRTRREKYNAIIEEIRRLNQLGRPSLVGTVSVDVSETLARMLKRAGIRHSVLNAKQHQSEAEIVANAGRSGTVTIATNMAGRGTDIKLDPDVREMDDNGIPGGLQILGTERHEARRIDRQLRGRSGRQGDPGSSVFYLSLEDNLMRLFGSDRMVSIMEKLGVEEGEVITHPMVTRAIDRAQKRVEAQNFAIRKHLLEYDDVMNTQREVVYELRNAALRSGDVRERLFHMIEAVSEIMVEEHTDPGGTPADWDMVTLTAEYAAMFFGPLTLTGDQEQTFDRTALLNHIIESAQKHYRHKAAYIDPEILEWNERVILLSTIDDLWKEHLYEMDQLKEGIGLRGYGQRDPLVEYKREGYIQFDMTLKEINATTLKTMFRGITQARVNKEDGPKSTPTRVTISHDEVDQFASGSGPDDASAQQQASPPPGRRPQKPQTVVHDQPKVGRNDPCPCGSGKKYKQCHGR
jgi:preprotein translocase subunit SecA